VAVEQFTLRSVDSECAGRGIEPRNCAHRGSRHCPISGRQDQSAVVAERRGPAGVGEHGTYIMGSPGTWEILSSPSESRLWESGKQSRARGGCAFHRGSELKAQRRYCETKGTKRRGKGGRKSECFILPWKRGTKPEGPCGGKGAPEHGTVRGKYGGDIELHDRINETRADSKAGARDAAGEASGISCFLSQWLMSEAVASATA
jgi:hypothetical protein